MVTLTQNEVKRSFTQATKAKPVVKKNKDKTITVTFTGLPDLDQKTMVVLANQYSLTNASSGKKFSVTIPETWSGHTMPM